MIATILKNIGNIRTTVLGLAALLVTTGTAVRAFVDGEPGTIPDWQAVTIAAAAFISSLSLIIGAKD